MKHIKLIFLFSLLVFSLSVLGQNNGDKSANQIHLSVLNTENGLPQNDIHSIIQDNNGFMWFASNDGLIRYDGFDFKSFAIQDNNVSTNLAVSLFDNKKGDLFIGTADKGLFIYNYKTESYKRIYKHKIKAVGHLLVDKYNTIWLIDDELQLVSIKYNGVSKEIQIYPFKVQGFALNPQNEMTAYSKDKLLTADKDCNFRTVKVKNGAFFEYLLYYNNSTYLLYKQKLCRLNSSNELEQVCEMDIRNYYFTHNGNLIASNTDGIYYLSKSGDKYVNPKLLKNGNIWVTTFFEDTFGTLWIGTFRNGIFKIDAHKRMFDNFSYPINVEALLEDSKKRIWIGNAQGNLFCYKDISFTSLEPVTMPINSKPFMITGVFESKYDKTIYVSCVNGVMTSSVDAKNLNFKYHPVLTPQNVGYVQKMLFDSNLIWIASYNKGLFCYDISKNKIISHLYYDDKGHFPSNTTRSLMKDYKGNLWIGSDDGLIIIPKRELLKSHPKIKVILGGMDMRKNISNNYVLPIYEARDGSVWVGTLNGLNVLRNIDDNFNFINKVYSTKNGLSNNEIKSILEDYDGNIWVSTNRGINCISKKSDQIYSYSLEDGLQDYEFRDLAGIKLNNSNLIFGGIRGFNMFNPQNKDNRESLPKMMIVDFQIFNKSITLKDKANGNAILTEPISFAKEISLPYYDNSISLFFSSVNSGAQNKQIYRYILKNFDKEWTQTTSKNRIAKYTNLSSGNYEFVVEASNDGIIWSKAKTIRIIINNPYWLTWYAYIIYAIALSVIFYVIYTTIKRRQENIKRIFISQQEKEQIKKISQAKIELFTNLSHEFRTPLSLIMSPLQMLMSNKNFDDKSIKLLNIIDKNSHLLLRLVNQIMDFSKNDKGTLNVHLKRYDIVNFAKDILEQFSINAKDKNIDLQFFCACKSFLTYFDKNQMEEIIYNLLSNAIKYTEKDGTVSLDLNVEGENLIMRVSDTGCGMSKEESEHIFDRFYTAKENHGVGIGLTLTKALVEAHEGKIEFTSKLGEGSCFIVSFPINLNRHNDINDDVKMELPSEQKQSEENAIVMDLPDDGEIVDLKKTYTTIMIVDDNNETLEFLTSLFSSLYRVVTANNGEEALSKCEKALPNIIISDIMMPVMDGIEFCKQIKSSNLTSHIPVILLTAKVSKQAQEEGLDASADAYIFKPYDNQILLSTVKSLLKNRNRLIQKYKEAFVAGTEEFTDNDVDKEFIEKLIEIIENNISDTKFNVEFVCNKIGMNQINLNKKLRELTGQTANGFIKDLKLKKAAQMLSTKKYTVAEITYAVGFNDLRYFRESFHRKFGVLPSEYKNSNGE